MNTHGGFFVVYCRTAQLDDIKQVCTLIPVTARFLVGCIQVCLTVVCQRTKPLRGMGAPIQRLRLVLSVLVVDW